MPRFPRSVILRAGEPRELLKNKAPNSSVIPEARRGGGAAQGEAGGSCRLLLWGMRDRRENSPGWEHAWASQNLSRAKLCHVQGSWKGFARGLYPPGLLWKAGGEGAQVWSTVRPVGSQTLCPGLWGFIPRALSSRSLASPLHPKSPHALQELAASCHPLQDDAAATSGVVLFICELFFIQLSSLIIL